jgi:fermentation-respiration switch protein FrsA (DUF1100 family)
MLRLFVFAPAVVFGAFGGVVHLQDFITYVNWIPDDYASAVQTARPSAASAVEVFITTPDGERLHALWCDTAPSLEGLPEKPVVLFCDGNAWSVDHARWVVDRWTSMVGADVLVFDYRGYGRSTGRPSEEGLYADACAAYDWLLKEKKVDPGRVVIVGQSLGGGVAMHLAGQVDHQLLVLESTFTSLPEAADAVFFPAPMGAFCRERFPNLDRIRRYKKPVFVSHGDCDTYIPCAHGERLAAAAGGPRYFWKCEGLGHDDCRDEARYAALVRDFFERHWKPAAGGPAPNGACPGKIAAAGADRPSLARPAARPAGVLVNLPGTR